MPLCAYASIAQDNLDSLLQQVQRDAAPVYVRHAPDSIFTLRLNALYAATGTPNLGFEVPLGAHTSLGANVGYKWWDGFFGGEPADAPRRWRHLAVAPGFRYYPRATGDGFFFGPDLLYTHYNAGNVTFPLGLYKAARSGYMQGNLYGAGLALGYVFRLSRHLRLEVEAGAAGGWYSDDTYYIDSKCRNCIVDHRKGATVVPKLGLNLAWAFGPAKRPRVEPDDVQPVAVDTVRAIEPQLTLPLVEEWKGVAGQLEKNHPVLRPSSEYKPYTPDMILRKMEDPLYVHFKVDEDVIEPAYRNNSDVLDQILDITSQIMADTTSRVSCIQIIGLSSIEGREMHNYRLSERRAVALPRYIQDRLPVADSVFERVAGGEAWTEFRDQVNDLRLSGGGAGLTPAQLDVVLEILDADTGPATREQRLRSLEAGRIYARLKETLLSDQRNSGYIRIYYDYVPDSTCLQINEAIALLRDDRSEEALRLLEPVKDDPRAASALAVALWRTGRQAEAVSVLRTAAATDAAAARNLEEMERVIAHNRHAGEPIYELKNQ